MSGGEERIDLWRLSRSFLLFLVLPFVVAIALDLATGLWPILTIAAVVLVFPFAGVVMIRKVNAEMQRVIEIVAPAAPAEEGEPPARRFSLLGLSLIHI